MSLQGKKWHLFRMSLMSIELMSKNIQQLWGEYSVNKLKERGHQKDRVEGRAGKNKTLKHRHHSHR